MKRNSVQRLLATLLSLLVVISMFTVCGLGVLAEDTIVADWNHRDVLSDSSRDETYASGGEEVVIGAQTSANTWDVFNEAPWDPNGKFTQAAWMVSRL